MAKRYLMRLGKSPFEPVDGFHSYDRNTIGGNNGNLIFGAAAHKLFSTADTEVDANHYRVDVSMADEVNADYDGFILPLANAFRKSFEPELLRTTEFIEKLTIPFLMLSGGAQLSLDGNPASLRRIAPTVKRFARAVLDKSSVIAVRGELTADYLRSLGFSDVIVVGCPSMTMNGRGHQVQVPDRLAAGAPIAYNLQPTRPLSGALIADAEAHYDATYFPQDQPTLEHMLWGTQPYTDTDPRLPMEPGHPQFREQRAEYHLDAHTWTTRLAQVQFCFGQRIHGNIAAILAGTPAMLLAHDGRTLELARYHRIPHLETGGETPPLTVDELFAQTDFTEFNRGHGERFDRISSFIHDNGFDHIYDPGQERARADYEQRMDQTPFPAPQKSFWAGASDHSADMAVALQHRHRQQRVADHELKARAAQLSEQQALLARRLEELDERLQDTDQRLGKARNQLADVTRKAAATQRRLDRILRVPAKAKRALTLRRPAQ